MGRTLPFNRVGIADEIIAFLKSSTKTKLATIEDAQIQYMHRRPQDIANIDLEGEHYGVRVGLADGAAGMSDMGVGGTAIQNIFVWAVAVGDETVTDAKNCEHLAEEIEEEIFADGHLRLTHGATLETESEPEHSPYTLPGGADWGRLHVVYMEFTYRIDDD